MKLHRLVKTVQVAAPLVATAVLTVACGSSSSSGVAGSAALNATTAAVSAAPTASGTAAASASVTIETHSGPLGTYLTDSAGKTVYLWVADTAGKSTCTGACAGAWPPVVGTPKAGGSVMASSLGTVARSDGSHQVTYGGHPLYYFVGDKTAGATVGQGNDGFGAKWWVVSPAGVAITATGAATTSTKSGY